MLSAISPIDGRYFNKTKELAEYFSEFALIRFRVRVDVEYFIALCEKPLKPLKSIDKAVFSDLRKIYLELSAEDAKAIKDIEQTTNHDVKAVEYFLKGKFDELQLGDFKEFIHFGLTSQDINNTAFPLMIKLFLEEKYFPLLQNLLDKLKGLCSQWKDIPMLAFTHGQAASPTRLGKELEVFNYRLGSQLKLLKAIPHTAKFGGAIGNFNAHYVAYPHIDWRKFADDFLLHSLQLERERCTTQISNYDNLSAQCDALKRINTILLDLCIDIWLYISKHYFSQKIRSKEVGSSAMPHKVNPIDFENAEGNLGIANALFSHLAGMLPVSRLQRDLTDSTVLRNIGVPFAHNVIAIKSLLKGLDKLHLNSQNLQKDLEENWMVVAEGIQTILRRELYPQPYEKLKELTRKNKKITRQTILQFIDELDVPEVIKNDLRKITPYNYTGI